MSFAGKITRGGVVVGQRGVSTPRPGRRPIPSHQPEIDWQHVAIFAAGLAIGVTVGAGTALLLAPKSGRDTRRSIARKGRRLRSRTQDAWDDLRDELREAASRSGKSLKSVLRRRQQQPDDVDEL